jgi:hypothetical protein
VGEYTGEIEDDEDEDKHPAAEGSQEPPPEVDHPSAGGLTNQVTDSSTQGTNASSSGGTLRDEGRNGGGASFDASGSL